MSAEYEGTWGGRLWNARTAWCITGLTLLLYAAFAVIFYTPITPSLVRRLSGGALTGFFVFAFAPAAVVGGVIAARRPRFPIGWILVVTSTVYVVGVLCSLIGTLLVSWHIPAARWILLGSALWNAPLVPSSMGLVLLVLLFPDGHLRSRRWLALIYLSGLLVAAGLVISVTYPDPGALGITTGSDPGLVVVSPFAIRGAQNVLATASTVVAVAGIVVALLALVSVFRRLRDADSDRRHQIRWFAYGALITFVFFVLVSVVPSSIFTGPTTTALLVVGPIPVIAGFALPVSIAVAVLKYHLYDIDLILSRTLVYGALALFITAVYVGIAVGIGALIGGGGKPNLALSIVATAIVAVGFQPVRERVQRVANHLVYGTRATPYEVLSQFSERVAELYATDDVMPRMARVLAEGTGAQRAGVWLRSGAAWREAAVWPAHAAHAESIVARDGTLPAVDGTTRLVEVRHQGDLLGALSVTKHSGDALTPVEENLVAHLAGQAGLVLRNVGLTSDLQARLEELRASRQRLVTAQDAERRRLERNLHDGAQQHLVAIKVKLGLAEMLLGRDAERAKLTLEQLKGDTDEALETLRDLARGIYPPLLAERGLEVALLSQARKAMVQVTVEAAGVGRYSQDIEAAVYFCALEALQNVQKYANASQVVIRVREHDGMVEFEVEDNGVGFDPDGVRLGSGLTNMEDRLDALGGSLRIRSSPEHGTIVSGSLTSVGTATALAM